MPIYCNQGCERQHMLTPRYGCPGTTWHTSTTEHTRHAAHLYVETCLSDDFSAPTLLPEVIHAASKKLGDPSCTPHAHYKTQCNIKRTIVYAKIVLRTTTCARRRMPRRAARLAIAVKRAQQVRTPKHELTKSYNEMQFHAAAVCSAF